MSACQNLFGTPHLNPNWIERAIGAKLSSLGRESQTGSLCPTVTRLGCVLRLLTQFFLSVELTCEDFDNVLAFLACPKMLLFLFVQFEVPTRSLGQIKQSQSPDVIHSGPPLGRYSLLRTLTHVRFILTSTHF